MMIQDIGPHRLRNQYSERTESGPDSPVFVFMGPKLLIKENTEHYFEQKAGKAFDGTRVSMPEAGIEWNEEKQFYRERGRFLRLPEREELGVGEKDLTYLFTVDERPTFLLRKALKDEEIPEGFSFIDIRTMRQAAYGPQHRLFAAITAYQLSNWYRDNRFCGTCGHPTVHSETERALCCPSCGRTCMPGMKFCTNCGTRLEQPATDSTEKRCRTCGATLEPNQRFCMECGTPV